MPCSKKLFVEKSKMSVVRSSWRGVEAFLYGSRNTQTHTHPITVAFPLKKIQVLHKFEHRTSNISPCPAKNLDYNAM